MVMVLAAGVESVCVCPWDLCSAWLLADPQKVAAANLSLSRSARSLGTRLGSNIWAGWHWVFLPVLLCTGSSDQAGGFWTAAAGGDSQAPAIP